MQGARGNVTAQERAETAQRLMTALARGDRTALARLIALFGAGVRAYAAQALDSPADAEDVAQEVFLRVWARADRYDPTRGAVSTWIWRIALNLCIDRNRRGGVRRFLGLEAAPELADDDPRPEARVDSRQRLDRVRGQIARLPARQRQAILLRASAEMSTAQIAETMGIASGAAEQLLVRARKTLRQAMDPGEETA
ncbi:RNA polymerase sigma factor [Actibacterium ureilyticum]|uniref:RNA polymerase sigma factor n=1 Tax=Actibacterium ureilyticum TaxID=1590614 RepID=UPI000BAA99FA|nr:sigma-70 family RNA polymerase sigma factor [Actibacterium ureilyticum]